MKWECEKGHKGNWNSCADVQGMPLNTLLVSASVLFTGAKYSDIADWAELMNLQVLKKTTHYAVQSSYLIPVIDAACREKQRDIFFYMKCTFKIHTRRECIYLGMGEQTGN